MATAKRVRAQLAHDALTEEDQRPPQREKRPRGRPLGALGKLTREAVEHAKATGEMPHYFLLRIARGEMIEQKILNQLTGEVTEMIVCPPFDQRVDAAKAAAPYFAPKLAAIEQTQAYSDEELDEHIRNAAAACGLAIATDGEGETGSTEEADAGEAEDRWI